MIKKLEIQAWRERWEGIINAEIKIEEFPKSLICVHLNEVMEGREKTCFDFFYMSPEQNKEITWMQGRRCSSRKKKVEKLSLNEGKSKRKVKLFIWIKANLA